MPPSETGTGAAGVLVLVRSYLRSTAEQLLQRCGGKWNAGQLASLLKRLIDNGALRKEGEAYGIGTDVIPPPRRPRKAIGTTRTRAAA
jgi:hypothetical protein